jgi:hypothetical protein
MGFLSVSQTPQYAAFPTYKAARSHTPARQIPRDFHEDARDVAHADEVIE